MTRKSIGDIGIEDYLRMTQGRRPAAPRARNALKAVGVALAALLFMAAGNYIRPWTGKDTLTFPFEQGLESLEAIRPEPEVRGAIGVAYRGAEKAIHLLGARAKEPGKVGVYARVALANAANEAVAGLQELARDGAHVEKARADLEKLFVALKKENPWLK